MDDARKPRILHVLKSSIYSGAENVVITIIKNLGDDFEFLYLATEGAVRERLEQEHIPFLLLKKFNRRNLKQVIKAWRPDIVHAHDFSATVLCSTMPGSFQLISHLHYDPPWVKRWNAKTCVYRIASVRIYKILTVSKKSFENMVFEASLESKQISVGNPLDVEQIEMLGGRDVIKKKYDLIFVGRFVEQKNPQRFIHIVKLLRDRKTNVICAMLGSGKLERECRELIHVFGLENQVDLLGFCNNPYSIIKEAKILCMTSKWEGYGLVLVEANILGIPVLSSRTSGAVEVLGEQAQEICDEDTEFVQKIEFLLQNEEEYKRWQQLAEQRVSELATMEDYESSIRGIYIDALRGAK